MGEINIEKELNKYKKEISKKFCEKEEECRICEDNYIGTISFHNNKFTWNNDENYILKEKRNENCIEIDKKCNSKIVIILESPHIEEYATEKPMPALGKTGEALDKHLLEILNKYYIKKYLKNSFNENEEKKFDIILMNAIQYQTSLGVDTSIYRDRVWLKMWLECAMRENFIERLKSYNPNIIFNFCTKGNHRSDIIGNINGKCKNSINQTYLNTLKIKNLEIENNTVKFNNIVVCDMEFKRKKLQGYTLRNFVNNAIKSSGISNCKVFSGPHPSSWTRKGKKFDIDKILKRCSFELFRKRINFS